MPKQSVALAQIEQVARNAELANGLSMAELAETLRSPDLTEQSIEELGGWLWETDSEHRFTYMSAGVSRLCGRPVEEHLGRTREEIGNVAISAQKGQPWLSVLERREPLGPVDYVRWQGGALLRFRTIGVACFDCRGSFRGYAGAAFLLHAADAPAPERREATASREKEARVAEVLVARRAPILCLAENLSEAGACLRLMQSAELPGTFELRLLDGAGPRSCEVRWRRGDWVGVSFPA